MNNDFGYMKFIYLHYGEETNLRDPRNLKQGVIKQFFFTVLHAFFLSMGVSFHVLTEIKVISFCP